MAGFKKQESKNLFFRKKIGFRFFTNYLPSIDIGLNELNFG